MKKVKITAISKGQYDDLMAKYENPIEHTCDVCEGHSWVSEDGKCPDGSLPPPSSENIVKHVAVE